MGCCGSGCRRWTVAAAATGQAEATGFAAVGRAAVTGVGEAEAVGQAAGGAAAAETRVVVAAAAEAS